MYRTRTVTRGDSKIDFLVNIIENDELSRHNFAKEQGKDQHIQIVKSKIKGGKSAQNIDSNQNAQ